MDRAMTDEGRGVAAATIARLLSILLQAPSADLYSTAGKLRRLMDDDGAFRQWTEKSVQKASKPDAGGVDAAQKKPAAALENRLAANLPQLLCRAHWLTTQAAQSPDSTAKWLLDAANLAARTEALQQNFHAELQSQFDRAAYNFAYGLSHELNNPLANISTRAGVLLQDSDSPDSRRLLSAIIDNAMRGCEMLGDLMLVARPPKLEISEVSVADSLNSLADSALPHAESRGIKLTLHVDENLPGVQADETALREALWAVARNAMEALPDGGNIDIGARLIETKPIAEPVTWHDSQNFVHIQISDNGSGLTNEALKSCFDIFYSSREAGRGLGVGLAKAKRIIDLHAGKISIANRPSGGCSVIVLLPV